MIHIQHDQSILPSRIFNLMSEYGENLFRPEKEQNAHLQLKVAETPEEIQQFLAFADKILDVDWESEGPPEEYTPEWIAENPDFTKIFIVQDESKTIVAGAKVKMLDDRTRERLALDSEELTGQTGVLLEYEAVKTDHRQQGLLKALTAKRIDWAKERGATYTCAEIAVGTPISAYIKARQGFKYISIQKPGEGILEPYFVVIKPISDSDTKITNDQDSPEKKEVVVNEEALDTFPSLFADGWVGVDAKINGDTFPWTLILEKQA